MESYNQKIHILACPDTFNLKDLLSTLSEAVRFSSCKTVPLEPFVSSQLLVSLLELAKPAYVVNKISEVALKYSIITSILGNFATRDDNKEYIDLLISRGFLQSISELISFVHSQEHQELFENIVLCLGNMVSVSESIRIKIFSTDLMDLIVLRYRIFEGYSSSAKFMIWLIANTLNSQFHLLDVLQFRLFNQVAEIFFKHPSEENFIEALWSMRYLLAKHSNLLERVQCILKSNFPNIIVKYVKKGMESNPMPEWMRNALEGLRFLYTKTGTSYCQAEFVDVLEYY